MVGERLEPRSWRWGACVGLGLASGLWAGGAPACVAKEGLSRPPFRSCAGRPAFAASTCTARPARRRSAPRTSGRRSCGARSKVGRPRPGRRGAPRREARGAGRVVGRVRAPLRRPAGRIRRRPSAAGQAALRRRPAENGRGRAQMAAQPQSSSSRRRRIGSIPHQKRVELAFLCVSVAELLLTYSGFPVGLQMSLHLMM